MFEILLRELSPRSIPRCAARPQLRFLENGHAGAYLAKKNGYSKTAPAPLATPSKTWARGGKIHPAAYGEEGRENLGCNAQDTGGARIKDKGTAFWAGR